MDFSFYGLISFFVNGFDILLLFHMNYSLNVALNMAVRPQRV